MEVKRIVANLEAQSPEKARAFYENIFGLALAMDHGWIQTYTADSDMRVQLSVASEGGSGTAVPALSIEVDDLESGLARVNEANVDIEYGPAREPWGVRRFYVRDPLGTLINVLQHE